MSIRRALVLLTGIVLLGLNVSFPYASYPEKEFDDAGRLLRSTVHHRFMPLWEAPASRTSSPQGQPIR